MTVIANAKLNLYLDITGRREDGYHTLEMVMQSVSLSDVLEVEISDGSGITLSCDAAHIPSDERNIAYKAAERYLDIAGIEASVDISIKKRIPSGAGMGGGSADAAAVLRALDRRFGLVTEEKLHDIALSIGADVPFCLTGGTKICRGIGEDISECRAVENCVFLVVMPDFTCPTAAAYKKYDDTPIASENRLSEFVCSISDGSFPERMHNTFEMLYNDSRIEDIKSVLTASGARGAMLTGSGAAVFGVFDDEQTAAEASKRLPKFFTAVCTPVNEAVMIF